MAKYLDQAGLSYFWGKIKGFVNSHEHPVGSVYITISSNFNPANQWGGTWEKTAVGRCLIGASPEYPLGSTGGENTHFINAKNIPPHTHLLTGFPISWKTSGSGTHIDANMIGGSWSDNRPYITNNVTSSTFDNETNSYTQQAMNNMQSYLAVNIWKRIK